MRRRLRSRSGVRPRWPWWRARRCRRAGAASRPPPGGRAAAERRTRRALPAPRAWVGRRAGPGPADTLWRAAPLPQATLASGVLFLDRVHMDQGPDDRSMQDPAARRLCGQRPRLDARSHARAAEGLEALLADLTRRGGRVLEEFARVEFAAVLAHRAAHRAGHRQADVGVDVDLAHAVADAFADLIDRHAIGFLDVAAMLADDGQPFLRHRRGAVHHEMRVGDARVDLLDA